MRTQERGFTLIELVVAVGIAVMLLGGALWMFAMRPAAVRHAVDEYDGELAVARAIAASSGNGATMVFAPAMRGSGFTIAVYAGRPTAANAVTATQAISATNDASVRERTLGAPPFAVFFDSAGRASGQASYPAFDPAGHAQFATLAQQPPCPRGDLLLTFTGAQGASDTRTLACAQLPSPAPGAPNPSPTPNPVHLAPAAMVAHWTSDRGGALRFRVAEFGYDHWYAKGDAACDAVAAFASPNPYATPPDPAEALRAPLPPLDAPISYPDTNARHDQPIAPFELWPVAAGSCVVSVADDAGQRAYASVLVMGDLSASAASLTFASPAAPAQTIALSKTWDAQPLGVQAGGDCVGLVTWSARAAGTPSSPGTTPARATLTVAPLRSGSCVLIVGDQYGEPNVRIPIEVKAVAFKTWPASLVLGLGGAPVGTTSGTLATLADAHLPIVAWVAPALNALLAGGTANASAYSGGCYAQAFASGTSGTPDTSLPQAVATALNASITTDGCILNATGTAPYGEPSPGVGTPTGVMLAYEPSGNTGNFQPTTSCRDVIFGAWYPASSGITASLAATGAASGTCTVDFIDGNPAPSPSPDAGQVVATVNSRYFYVNDSGRCAPSKTGFSDICTGSISATALNASGTAIASCYTSGPISGGPSSSGNLGGGMDLPTRGKYAVVGVPTSSSMWTAELNQAITTAEIDSFGPTGGGFQTFLTPVTSGCP